MFKKAVVAYIIKKANTKNKTARFWAMVAVGRRSVDPDDWPTGCKFFCLLMD